MRWMLSPQTIALASLLRAVQRTALTAVCLVVKVRGFAPAQAILVPTRFPRSLVFEIPRLSPRSGSVLSLRSALSRPGELPLPFVAGTRACHQLEQLLLAQSRLIALLPRLTPRVLQMMACSFSRFLRFPSQA